MKDFFRWASEKKILQEKLDSNFTSVVLVPDNIDKFTVNFYINDRPYIIEKAALRRFFGNVLFPSNSFALEVKHGNFTAYGEGLGHGVGLCQMGAFTMARMGWSYKKILAHYFPEHVLKKMY
jgi:stage II sporulation protein D